MQTGVKSNLCITWMPYPGNLGGVTGADNKCVSDCGSGYRFANLSDISKAGDNITKLALTVWYSYDHGGRGRENCRGWTSSLASDNGLAVEGGTFNVATVVLGSDSCDIMKQVLCTLDQEMKIE